MSRQDPAHVRPRHAPKAGPSDGGGAGLLLADDLLVLFGEAAASLPAEAKVEPGRAGGAPGFRGCLVGAAGGGARITERSAVRGGSAASRRRPRPGDGTCPGRRPEVDPHWRLAAARAPGPAPETVGTTYRRIRPGCRHDLRLPGRSAFAAGPDGTSRSTARGPSSASCWSMPASPRDFSRSWPRRNAAVCWYRAGAHACLRAAEPAGAGELPAVLESDSGSLEAVRMTLAAFQRDDVLAPAVGIVAFARIGAEIPPEQSACDPSGRRASLLPARGELGPSGGPRARGGYLAPAANTAAAEGARASATGPQAHLPPALSRRRYDVELVRAGARRQGSAAGGARGRLPALGLAPRPDIACKPRAAQERPALLCAPRSAMDPPAAA